MGTHDLPGLEAQHLSTLGALAEHDGDLQTALVLLRRSSEVAKQCGFRMWHMWMLGEISEIVAPARSRRRCEAAPRLRRCGWRSRSKTGGSRVSRSSVWPRPHMPRARSLSRRPSVGLGRRGRASRAATHRPAVLHRVRLGACAGEGSRVSGRGGSRSRSHLRGGRRARDRSDRAVELQDHRDVLLRVVEEPALAHGARSLVVARRGRASRRRRTGRAANGGSARPRGRCPS